MKIKKRNLIILIIGFVFCSVIMVGCSGQSDKYYKSEIVDFYHDQAHIFMQPLEPTQDDNVTIRIRVRHGNVKSATLRFSIDVEKTITADMQYINVPMEWEKTDSEKYYDYFIGIIPKQQSPYKYHFVLSNDCETIYANASSEVSVGKPFLNANGDYYVMPGFKVPDWAKGALWYSAMTDSFFNGDTTNDKLTSQSTIQNGWGNNHYGGNDYFGGDFKGIQSKMDYLNELNVDALFINPIWETTHQAGYGSFDLKNIDSAFGNEKEFKALVDSLHANNKKIMLDGVFRYAHGAGNLYNQNGMQPLPGGVKPSDPYYDFFMRNENGNAVLDWGQPVLDFSSPGLRKYIYTEPDSVMQYYLREFDVDGWRLDVGPSLRGSQEGAWDTAEKIIKDMRRYVKGVNNDKLLISEHGDGALLTDYTLDSKWSHYNYTVPVRSWMANKKTENVLLNDLYAGVLRMPRQIANASYNYTTSHDLSRASYIAEGDISRLMASNILTMTYVGAPTIYFGDEIGMPGTPNAGVTGAAEPGAAPSSFGAMNWDKNTWNYELFNLQKAMGQLRKDYNKVYKDGAYITLFSDISKNIMSYGRFNEGGYAITVTNTNDTAVKGVQIEARKVGASDGDTITDYLSGKTYKVDNGTFTADVMPGGSVFVSGKGGSFSGSYEVCNINNNSKITRNDAYNFSVSGSGKLEKTSDSITFAAREVINNCELNNKVGSGNYALMARNSDSADSAFYAVELRGNSATVKSRKIDGAEVSVIGSFNVTSGNDIKLVRKSDDVFEIYERKGNEFVVISGTKAKVILNQTYLMGFAPIDGSGNVGEITLFKASPQLSSYFQNGLGSMFVTNDKNYSFNANGLVLNADSAGNKITSNPVSQDYSFKTLSLNAPTGSDEYGIFAQTSEKNGVYLVRCLVDGKNTVKMFQRINGEYKSIDSCEFKGAKIYLQLEKVGYNFTGRYSLNGTDWIKINGIVNANYSNVAVGLVSKGSGAAKFEFACYGDAGKDGSSTISTNDYGYMNLSMENMDNYSSGYTTSVTGGKWDYVAGGIYQSQLTGKTSLNYISDYKNFRLNGTFKLAEMADNGYIGVAFGSKQLGSINEFTVKIDKTGNVLLSYSDTELSKNTINMENRKYINLSVDVVSGNYVDVYVDGLLIISQKTSYSAQGKVSFIGENASFTLGSYSTWHKDANWIAGLGTTGKIGTIVSGSGDNQSAVINIGANTSEMYFAYASKMDSAVGDFVFSGNVQIEAAHGTKRGKVALIVGGNAGANPSDSGVMVSADTGKEVAITKNGKMLKAVTLQYNPKSFFMTVVVINGKIDVYIDNYAESGFLPSVIPALSYELGYQTGGAFNIYGEYTSAKILKARLYGLKEGENYRTLNLFTQRPIDEPPLPEPPVLKDNINTKLNIELKDKNSLFSFYKYENGIWAIDDGVLKGTANNWNSGATIAAGKSGEQYDFEYKIKHTGGGWGGIIVNKSHQTHNHETSGILIFTSNNEVNIYDGGNLKIASGVTLDDGFMRIKISQRIVGGKHVIKVYINGDEKGEIIIEDSKRSASTQGYISLNLGNSSTEFKDIIFTPINL